MNLSYVIGNLGSDAEVKNVNGSKFITFSVADSRKWKDQEGKEHSETNWIDAVISNAEHAVLPYLKQGTKVAIVGNSSLRVFSSKKDRMMKAGQTIHVLSIELCGGQSDEVPRQLIDPETGAVFQTAKYYWTEAPTAGMNKDQVKLLIDARGNIFQMDCHGFVKPLPPQEPQKEEEPGEQQQAKVE